MKTHQINVIDFVSYLKEDNYHTFASSTVESKKLQAAIGKEMFRVLHGQEIVYEGVDKYIATSVYNNIVGEPKNQPKIEN